MRIDFFILLITGFIVLNIYHDGKYIEELKKWKKYYHMMFYGFLGLSLYWMSHISSHTSSTPGSSQLLKSSRAMIQFSPTSPLAHPSVQHVSNASAKSSKPYPMSKLAQLPSSNSDAAALSAAAVHWRMSWICCGS